MRGWNLTCFQNIWSSKVFPLSLEFWHWKKHLSYPISDIEHCVVTFAKDAIFLALVPCNGYWLVDIVESNCDKLYLRFALHCTGSFRCLSDYKNFLNIPNKPRRHAGKCGVAIRILLRRRNQSARNIVQITHPWYQGKNNMPRLRHKYSPN